jgi:iron complex outermembrane receptor protein
MSPVKCILLSTVAFATFIPQSFSETAINEITVIARKRAEVSRDVPIAITNFTSEDIQSAGIEKPSDFINLTPNVTLVQTRQRPYF